MDYSVIVRMLYPEIKFLTFRTGMQKISMRVSPPEWVLQFSNVGSRHWVGNLKILIRMIYNEGSLKMKKKREREKLLYCMEVNKWYYTLIMSSSPSNTPHPCLILVSPIHTPKRTHPHLHYYFLHYVQIH